MSQQTWTAGEFRAELQSACPSIHFRDVDWIVAYFTAMVESFQRENAELRQTKKGTA